MRTSTKKAVREITATAIAFVAFVCGGGFPVAAQSEDGELWVTSQGTHRLFILHDGGSDHRCCARGGASIETLQLPAGAGAQITTFPPSGQFAYVSGMGNGDLFIIRADDRQIVQARSISATPEPIKPSRRRMAPFCLAPRYQR
jgi:hypothetical protein